MPLAIGLNFDFFGLYTSLQPELYWGGEQAAWWGPMAVAIIAGILFATFLTLILVPVMYSLVDDTTEFFREYFVNTDEEQSDSDGGPRFGHDVPADEKPTVEVPALPAREPEPVGALREKRRSGGLGQPQPEAG